VLIKNCSCQLGDVIDDRHMSWIEMSTSQTESLESSLLKMKNFAGEVSDLSAQVMCIIYDIKKVIVCVCIYVYICIYIYIDVYTYIYIYIYIHIHNIYINI
jgi:hypothetical protein